MSILGKFGYSLIVTLLGLFIVFLGLVILIGCIKVMSKVVGKMRENAEAKKAASAPAAPAPVVVPEPVAEAAAEDAGVDENELVAVITAALMAYTKGSGNKTLVVKNIRRANAWANAGRADQLTRF